MKKFIAVDIGGTSIKYGIINEEGQVINRFETQTEAYKGVSNLINKVIYIIKMILEENHDISGIGISTAGVVDTNKGKILYASDNLPNYTGTEIKKILEEQFGLPIVVNNDVNSVALAEQWVGAGKGRKTFFCMTIGTGIGGAIIIDGKLHKGMNFRAAEIGYMNTTGENRYYEKKASTSALVNNVKQKLCIDNDIDGVYIFENIKSGNEFYREIFNTWTDEICKGIANIIYLFDPGLIIIGGGVSKQKDFLISNIKKNMPKYLPMEFCEGIEIDVAKCGNDAGMIGAVYELLK